jgi:exopolysaccharide production protein ExoZ
MEKPILSQKINKSTIYSLQAGRAAAAIMVALSHAEGSAQEFLHNTTPIIGELLLRGYLGVDFFFVLSGFIIYYTNVGLQQGARWLRIYTHNRLLRIYVPYLPIGIGLAVLYTVLPTISAGDRSWSWWASATLMPTNENTALNVAWTLRHELVFYAYFAILFLLNRVMVGAVVWSILCLALYLVTGAVGGPGGFQLTLVDIEFVFGIVAASQLRKGRGTKSRYLMLASIAALACFWLDGARRENSILFGLSIALMIVPVVRLERSGHLQVAPWLVLLGNASYAIYLVHEIVISIVARLFLRVPPLATPSLMVPSALLASVLAGIAMHRIYERPAIAFLHRLGKRDSRDQQRGTMS